MHILNGRLPVRTNPALLFYYLLFALFLSAKSMESMSCVSERQAVVR
jgi:hypothetical protein